MLPPPLPPDEAGRIAALRSYEVLDTACEEAFDNITRLAARITGSPIAVVSLVDAERQWFKSRFGLDAQETPRELAFCAHAILRPDQALVVPDATQDARFAGNPLVTGAPDIRFYAGVPLVNPEGFALGTLCVIDSNPREVTAEALDNLTGLARTAETTLELRRAVRHAQEMALTDALTGLPNRPALLDALGRAIARQHRGGVPFSLIYLDLDGFKRVNDTRGHGEGDRVLREVGQLLRGCIRAGDLGARIGGDEFAAVLLGGDGAEAALAADRLQIRIARRMAECGWPVTASVGAVCFLDPPDGEGQALELVDGLMYAAKVAGKNRVVCRDHTHRAAAARSAA